MLSPSPLSCFGIDLRGIGTDEPAADVGLCDAAAHPLGPVVVPPVAACFPGHVQHLDQCPTGPDSSDAPSAQNATLGIERRRIGFLGVLSAGSWARAFRSISRGRIAFLGFLEFFLQSNPSRRRRRFTASTTADELSDAPAAVASQSRARSTFATVLPVTAAERCSSPPRGASALA